MHLDIILKSDIQFKVYNLKTKIIMSLREFEFYKKNFNLFCRSHYFNFNPSFPLKQIWPKINLEIRESEGKKSLEKWAYLFLYL